MAVEGEHYETETVIIEEIETIPIIGIIEGIETTPIIETIEEIEIEK